MCLEIQRSVNIFTISADAEAVVRFLFLLKPSLLLHSMLVTFHFLFFCTFDMNWSIYIRICTLSISRSYYRDKFLFLRFFFLHFLFAFDIFLFISFCLSVALPFALVCVRLSSHIFPSRLISSFQFHLPFLILFDFRSSMRMGQVCTEKEKHFRFVQFSICVSVRYHLKPNKCTFPVVRFLLSVNRKILKVKKKIPHTGYG